MIERYLKKTDYVLCAVCFIFIVVQVYLDLKIPEYMNNITDHLQIGTSTEVIVDDGVSMIVCALLSLGASIVAGVAAARIAASMCRELRRQQFLKVETFTRQDISRFSSASLITRSTNDVYNIQNFVTRGLQIVVKAPILGLWALMKINNSAFEWTATTAIAMVVLLCLLLFILHRFIPYTKNVQWLMDGVNKFTQENLDGSRVVRAYNAEDRQEALFNKANDRLLDNNVKMCHYGSPMQPVMNGTMNFLVLAIYWVGAGLIAAAGSSEVQMGLFSDMIVFSSYATMVLSAVILMTSVIRGFPRAWVSYQRINEVINYQPAMADGECDDMGEGGVSLEFRNVSFTYPGTDTEIIHNVSFKVEPGQTFAIIGPTGSGKTTLVNLIPRLYDATSGTVLVDGRDVREYTMEALHHRIGYVPQGAVIFSGSVRDNVNYGEERLNRDDGDVLSALDISQASEFVEKLDGGMDHTISQHGRNISGGQKQRLGIARAVCRRAGMYLFDDSFSALDFKTERLLRNALQKSSGYSTRIIVAQRVGSIMEADAIAVMDRGEIVGIGTHCELLRTCPLYKEIADSQMLGGDC